MTPKILVVDDNPLTLSTIEAILVAEQYHYQLAENREQCLELLESQSFYILITDLAMPEIEDGLALIDEVNQKYPSVVIIVHSGYSDHELIIKTLSQKKSL